VTGVPEAVEVAGVRPRKRINGFPLEIEMRVSGGRGVISSADDLVSPVRTQAVFGIGFECVGEFVRGSRR